MTGEKDKEEDRGMFSTFSVWVLCMMLLLLLLHCSKRIGIQLIDGPRTRNARMKFLQGTHTHSLRESESEAQEKILR
jgi:hypothetical protein